MANKSKEPSVSAAFIGILKNYVESMGADFMAIATTAGVELESLEDGSSRVPAHCVMSIWQQAVSANQDPHPGLSFGREMARHYPGGSILFTMMMNCPSVGCALDTFIRYHRIMADFVQPQRHQVGDYVHLTWEASHANRPLHPDFSEALICTYYAILKRLTHGKLQPVEIRFRHPNPGDLNPYQSVFKAPIRFGAQKDALVIEDKDLDIEIHLANKELFGILETHAIRIADTLGEGNNWTNKVLRSISGLILQGIKPDLATVAKVLALSRRNLQVILKSEKSNFRCCLKAVRKQIALDYLAQPEVSIGEVAFLLGYSEQSAFNHAFRRWTGKSPTAYVNGSVRCLQRPKSGR